ncbi:MAG TPA: cell division protein FtsZ [Methylomirabilota bacterium]|jgi:cell division protein FtsZ|nr:cell division protein FtsZ [Methylomirabilota bacterium]
MSTFELEIDRSNSARLKVIGCGGAGGNAVNRMIGAGLRGVEFIVANTDMQALAQSLAPTRIQIGVNTTRGLGSGGDPSTGRRSAEEDEAAITDAVADADMVFITAGMGGGTGTGSAPVVARLARQAGALTVAVVTKPFQFEGRRRLRQADEGLAELRNEVDTLLVIPNERLLSVVDKTTALSEAFSVADNVLLQATKGISELVTVPGLVNLDFADVKSIMACRGNALMGTGRGTGPNRAVDAASQAVSSPLLEDVSIHGAEGVLVNITGGRDLTLHEVNEAAQVVTQAAGDDANVIFGAVIDPSLDGDLLITVVATGFGAHGANMRLVERMQHRPQPLAVVNGTPAPAEVAAGQPQESGRGSGWPRRETRPQWGRSSSRADSLEVPTFLRRNMD